MYNVAFHKLPLERKAQVVALKDIEPGQEIFVDYGRWEEMNNGRNSCTA